MVQDTRVASRLFLRLDLQVHIPVVLQQNIGQSMDARLGSGLGSRVGPTFSRYSTFHFLKPVELSSTPRSKQGRCLFKYLAQKSFEDTQNSETVEETIGTSATKRYLGMYLPSLDDVEIRVRISVCAKVGQVPYDETSG